LGVDQKLLPAAVIKQTAEERAAQTALEQGYPVGRRQMRELKERVTEELRGRAFSCRRTTRAWIDPDRGRLIVDAGSPKRAEELIETLRDTLGSFAAQPLDTLRSPAVSMGAWLTFGEAPGRFNIEQDLELQSADENKSAVRYTRHPLDAEAKEVQKHINSGKTPIRLGLSWNDRVSFQLTAELQIKRVQFLDIVKDRAEQDGEAADEQFDIDFALMTGELSQMLTDLIDALGGEVEAQQRDAA
jgi:recombination associated protein RdgC